ncbi:MAG: hypothetical protein HDR06_20345 [Lachnospiraceae bacterium]|nr:hypothetical protein [Lachnospiraceae bacterium]
MEEYQIKNVDIKQFLHLVIGADGKPPIDFDMLQKEGHYIVHSGQERNFCMKEREIYLKDSMENLIAKSFCYFSAAGISFAIHIKDKTGKADISVLDNRRLSREIVRQQIRGKSLTIHYRGGRTQKCSLSTDQYIRGPFGEKINLICYGYLADSLMRMRRDMFSGRGEISAFAYEAENERSLSAVARKAVAERERNLKGKTLEQFKTWWEEKQLLQALKRQNYRPELSDKEKLATVRQLIHDGGYRRISTETAERAKEYNIPCFVPARDGNMDFVKDVKSLDKSLPIYIKTGWDKMLDILTNQKPVPCTRSILRSMEKAARDAYGSAAAADKPQLAGLAIKITYFLEAVDRHSLSGILQKERDSGKESKAPDFLSEPEKEKFRYLLDKEEQRVMMVADRTMEYYGKTR